MLAWKSAWNTKFVRRSIWKRETGASFQHATTHRRSTIGEKHRLGYIFINQLTNSSPLRPLKASRAQPICLPICMNTYFFRGRFVLHLQTGNVNRSAISSGAFAVFPLEIHWIQSWNTPPCLWNSKLRYPPTSSEFQSNKPPLSLGIPRCRPWYGMDIFWNHPMWDLKCQDISL